MSVLEPSRGGLTIRQRGEYSETVTTPLGEAGLSTSPQVDALEITLHRNMTLTLTPAGTANEMVYVLSGYLTCTFATGLQIVRDGDCLVSEKLDEPVMLSALTEARLFYITNDPQFQGAQYAARRAKEQASRVEDHYLADYRERVLAGAARKSASS